MHLRKVIGKLKQIKLKYWDKNWTFMYLFIKCWCLYCSPFYTEMMQHPHNEDPPFYLFFFTLNEMAAAWLEYFDPLTDLSLGITFFRSAGNRLLAAALLWPLSSIMEEMEQYLVEADQLKLKPFLFQLLIAALSRMLDILKNLLHK